MNSFKKNLASNITLISVLTLSVVHLVLLTLNLFNVLNFALPTGFSYIFAYILMVVCFVLFIFAFWVENIKTLKIPTWFKILFYIAFFVFTNIYYIFGLYSNIYFLVLFVVYIAFLMNICSLSIYFNINKDEKNKLKASTLNLIFNTTTYSLALCSFVELIISVIKVIFFAFAATATLLTFVIEFVAMLIVCVSMSIILAISHKKSKRIINGCLIKIVPKTISPSIKSSN